MSLFCFPVFKLKQKLLKNLTENDLYCPNLHKKLVGESKAVVALHLNFLQHWTKECVFHRLFDCHCCCWLLNHLL